MNNTISNSPAFTANIKLQKGLGNVTFVKAANLFEKITGNSNETIHMWGNNGVYKFDFSVKNNLSPTTQYVGRDVMGYLFMEKGVEGIAEFLKSTLSALKARQKVSNATENPFVNNIKANIEATMVYLKDKAIGEKLQTRNTSFDNIGYIDYDFAGSCLHLDA